MMACSLLKLLVIFIVRDIIYTRGCEWVMSSGDFWMPWLERSM